MLIVGALLMTAAVTTAEPCALPLKPEIRLEGAAFDSSVSATAIMHRATARGTDYLLGDGVNTDYQLALENLRIGADDNDPHALNNLGSMYDYGLGVDVDLGRAFRLYDLAAAQQLPIAIRNLGMAYVRGRGTSQNLEEGKRLLEIAARAGVAFAQYDLALLILRTERSEARISAAVEYLEGAAYAGFAPAASLLADTYQNGVLIPADTRKAFHWYQIGAKLEDPVANRSLPSFTREELVPAKIEFVHSGGTVKPRSMANQKHNTILPWPICMGAELRLI